MAPALTPRRASLLVGVACLLLSLFGGGRQAHALNLSNNKPVIQVGLGRGEAVQGSIELLNNGDQPLKVKAYLEDWFYADDGDGSKEFVAPGSSPRSSAGWVSFFPQAFDLPAAGRAVVDYTVRVPQDASLDGGYYAVLFFESMIAEASSPQADGVMVKYAARLGSLFLVEVKGTVRREARLAALSIAPPGGSTPLKLEGQLANEGNVSLSCSGSFHVLSQDNRIAARGELPHRYVWPGHQVPVSGEWAGLLPRGTYTAVATYDCGEELVILEERQFVAP